MIFLDFDGVLFDTVREAFVLTLLATGRKIHPAKVNFSSTEFQRFRRCRYLIGPAWNYFYLNRVLAKENGNKRELLEGKYRKLIASAKPKEYQIFERAFYHNRERFRAEDKLQWLTLNAPYRFLSMIGPLISAYRDRFFIVSTKDKNSVRTLLAQRDVVIPKQQIFGCEEYSRTSSKAALLRAVIDRDGVKRALLVEDGESHVRDCQSIPGLKIMVPKWGYVSPRLKTNSERQIARSIEHFLKGERYVRC